jgi:hypothetical protein
MVQRRKINWIGHILRKKGIGKGRSDGKTRKKAYAATG